MRNLVGLDLNLLVSLGLLLEEQSVRGAARRAGVTPSAMMATVVVVPPPSRIVTSAPSRPPMVTG